jgi:pheromone shutdown protein TraB
LMAIAMRRYYTMCIARWRRFVAFIKATKCHHRVSTCSDSINWTLQRRVSSISLWKRARVDMLAQNNNRGMAYQTDEKHLTNLLEYFVGAVKLAYCSLNTYLPLCVFTFTNNLLKGVVHAWVGQKHLNC